MKPTSSGNQPAFEIASRRRFVHGDCPEVVGRAAQWVAEVLLAEFTDDAVAEGSADSHAPD